MFNLAVFTDDISQDLDHALDVVEELGLQWIEIRAAWGKNLVYHTDETLQEIHAKIQARGLRVPCVAAPLFKSRLKGRGESSKHVFFAQEEDDMEAQLAILRRAAHIARLFDTRLIRSFSFWRLGDDPMPIWDELVEAYNQALPIAQEEDVVLVMENDFECNLAGGEEAARFIRQMDSPHLRLLWDPGNSYFVNETAYPTAYEAGKDTIGHVHLKDGAPDPETGKPRWVCFGSGEVDLLGQLRALKADGYSGVISMENHFTPSGGTPEDGVRQSFAGFQRLLAEV